MKKIGRLFSGRVVKNAGWLIGGNIIHKLVAFFVGIWTARYLGPENYGLINYATAYTTFFFSLSTLGINSVIVKNFVDAPKYEGITLGTTLVLQFVAGTLSIINICLIVWVVDYGETETIIVVFLCSLGLVFQIFDSVRYWFQAKLESKYAAVATLIAYLVTSLYRVVLLVRGMSVEWFAIASSVDYACVALILLVAYKRKGGAPLKFSWERAKALLGESHHFILSGLMVSIYGATDRLMLKQMLNETVVGYYGTAVSICNVWVFVLVAIIDSLNPVIMEAHHTNKATYEKRNRQLYAVVFYCSIFMSLLITIFANVVILWLYGEAYLPAVSQLRIITWYVAFSYLGVARNAWIVCERQQKYLVFLYIGAAMTNVILNAILIPMIGADGAALASLITQISTILIFPCLIKSLRPNVRLMFEAITLRKLK